MRFKIPFITSLATLAVLLRLYHLTYQNLWYDEVYSIDLSLKSFSEIFDGARSDMHPPLFYIVLKIWGVIFGHSIISWRGLSVVLSLIALYLCYKLGKSVLGKLPTLFAIVMMILSAHQIYYAQEARMYSLLLVLTLGTALAYRKWIDTNFSSLVGLGGYIWLGLAAISTHYFGMLILGAINIHFFYLIWCRWKDFEKKKVFKITKKWITCQFVIALFYLPWVRIFILQASRGQSWRTNTPLVNLPNNLLDFTKEIIFGYFSFRFIIPFLTTVVIGIICFCLLKATITSISKKDEKQLFIPILFAAPLVVASLISLRQSIQFSRYLLIITPYFFLLIGATISWLPRWWMRASFLGIYFIFTLFGVVDYYTAASRDSDFRPTLMLIQKYIQPGDRIAVDLDYMDICLEYYSREANLRKYFTFADHSKEADGYLNFIKTHNEVRRWWIILDYRSKLFEKAEENSFFTNSSFIVKSVKIFPNVYPNVKLVEVERVD